MFCNEQGVELRPWSLSGQSFIALLAAFTLATIVGLLFWNYANVAFDPCSIADADLSKLFSENPDMRWVMVTFLICAILHAQSPFPYNSPDACLCK
jgi:hypothetical protein